MRLDVHTNDRANCEQAFRFDQKHLGGRVIGMVRHGEQPHPTRARTGRRKSSTPFRIGSTVLMGPDLPSAEPMRSAYLTLTLDREAHAERFYARLADGGKIFMKMAKTPFANRFAMLRGRFCASWMLLHQPEP